MCSACFEVSVGALSVGDVSDLTEYLETLFGLLSSWAAPRSFRKGPCHRRPGFFAWRAGVILLNCIVLLTCLVSCSYR